MKAKMYLLIILFSSLAFSQPNQTFNEANEAYADDEFEKAIELYSRVLNQGLISPELYFNLGNAYYKQNDLANAIYHYEKALQLRPNDKDVLENLEIANTQTIDKIEDPPESNLNALLFDITHLLTVNTWAWVSIAFSLCFGFFIVLYFNSSTSRAKRRNFVLASLCVLCGILSFGFGRFQNQVLENQSYAIMFEDQVNVLVEPNPRSEVNFQLNKGTKVNTGSTFRDFTEIELPDGSEGWVPTSSFKQL
jgi:tetratricopeptide (TPR) repeat protein